MSPTVEQRDAPAEAAPVQALSSGDLRLDGPHLLPGSESAIPTAETVADAESSQTESQSVEIAGGEPHGAGHEQLLAQATQIAEHLKAQCAELDRREQRLHSQLALLDQEQRNVKLWVAHFESQIHDRDEALAQREAECTRKAAACLRLEDELTKLHDELMAQRQDLLQQREQFAREREATVNELSTAREHLNAWLEEARVELETERAEWDSSMAAERNRHRELLEKERVEFLEERHRRGEELNQERGRFENRMRFQADHLRRLRQEFEAQQAEVVAGQQRQQWFLAELTAQQERREGHLVRVRELLDLRIQSFEHELEQFARSRRLFEDVQETERTSLLEERRRWNEERETQQADLRRQQDLLAVHAENLETRRTRLDLLRAELEDTNRRTLEMRLAVEEANSQLCTALGTDAARERVEEARQLMAEYYRHSRDGLLSLRHELSEQESRLRTQTESLQEERDSLAAWAAQQEYGFVEQRGALDAQRRDLESREREWTLAADRWATDRAAAEAVIRDLLTKLQAQTDREAA